MKNLIKNINIFISGTKLMFKEFFNKQTNKKQRANMWSFFRLILVIPIFIIIIFYFISKNNVLLLITGILTLLGGVSDYLDGKCARKYNSFSEYGKKLDQIADKTFATTLSLLLLSINNFFIITFLLELLIIIINALYNIKYKNINNDSNMVGKLKQWPLFTLLIMGFLSQINKDIYNITFVLFVVTTGMQILTILSYIEKHTKEIKNYITSKIKGTKN